MTDGAEKTREKRHHWKQHEIDQLSEIMTELGKKHPDWKAIDRAQLCAARMTTPEWRPTAKQIHRAWWGYLDRLKKTQAADQPRTPAAKTQPAKVGHPMGPQLPLPMVPKVDLTPMVDALLEGLALLPSTIAEALEPMVARMEAAAEKMTEKEGPTDGR